MTRPNWTRYEAVPRSLRDLALLVALIGGIIIFGYRDHEKAVLAVPQEVFDSAWHVEAAHQAWQDDFMIANRTMIDTVLAAVHQSEQHNIVVTCQVAKKAQPDLVLPKACTSGTTP